MILSLACASGAGFISWLCFYAVHNGPNADLECDGVVLKILVFWSLWLVPDAEPEYDGVVLGSICSARRVDCGLARNSVRKSLHSAFE